jgi:hypothetical protein
MKLALAKLFAASLFFTFATSAFGATENASGNWKWSIITQNGDKFESTAKLKQDGEKLSGSVNGRFGEAEINDGSVKGDQVAFKVKREREGQEFVLNYAGKLSGDSIKGKIEFQRDGNTVSRDWDAKREKNGVAGKWNAAIILPDGNRIEGILSLKQDGEKLTGAVTRNDTENPILDGKIAGDEISFTTKRQRDGRTVTSKYKGKVTGDTIKGKLESDWSGDWQTIDWEGSRAK